jgi:hypothetical protein
MRWGDVVYYVIARCTVVECYQESCSSHMPTAKRGVYVLVTFERLSPVPPSFRIELQRHLYMYKYILI